MRFPLRCWLAVCLAYILCLAPPRLVCQTWLTLDSINPTNFPTVRAKMSVVRNNAQIKDLKPEQFRIIENGIPIDPKTIKITCPSLPEPEPKQRPLSLAMSFDISGSMIIGNSYIHSNTVAEDLIGRLDMSVTEVATQICNSRAMITTDFTDNRARIRDGFPVKAGGDNNFREQLLNDTYGLLPLTARGKHENRVAILYTDAFWYALSANELKRCIDICKAKNIRFYAVIFGPDENRRGSMVIAYSLRELARATGGQVYENVFSAGNLAEQLLPLVVNRAPVIPCDIEWQAKVHCGSETRRAVTMEYAKSINEPIEATATGVYTAPASSLAGLTISPSSIYLRNVVLGASDSVIISITAKGVDFKNLNIQLLFPDLRTPALGTGFSLGAAANAIKELQNGQTVKIPLIFAPTAPGQVNIKLNITSNLCAASIPLSGGLPGARPGSGSQPLTLTHPNGKEEFLVGTDTLITWQNIAPEDHVRLEYSIDEGKTWLLVAESASGLRHIWRNVPNTPSRRCLMRVLQLTDAKAPPGKDTTFIIRHDKKVNIAVFSPNTSTTGSLVLTGSDDKTSKIWGTFKDNDFIASMETSYTSNTGIRAVAFHNYNEWVVSVYNDSVSGAWRGWKLLVGAPHDAIVNTIDLSSDQGAMVTASEDGTARYYTIGDDELSSDPTAYRTKLVNTYPHNGPVKSAKFHPKNTHIVTASADQTVKVWEIGAEGDVRLKATLQTGAKVNYANFHPEKPEIIAAALESGIIQLWNWQTGDKIRDLTGHKGAVKCIDFNKNNEQGGAGTMLVSAGADKTVRLWDVERGAEFYRLTKHTDTVNTVFFNRTNDEELVSASSDGTAIIWKGLINQPFLQQDVSDNLWSIIKPEAVTINVDMGTVLVGKSRDSLVTAMITNTGTAPLNVQKIVMVGAHAPDFKVVGNDAPLTIAPGQSIPVEFRFSPQFEGDRRAQIMIMIPGDTLKTSDGKLPEITGVGVKSFLDVNSVLIDFGRVQMETSTTLTSTLVLRYNSSAPIRIDSVVIVRPDGARYQAGKEIFFITNNGTLSQSLPAFTLPASSAGEYKLDLAFRPDTIAFYNAQMLFYYSSPHSAGSPATAFLTGQGIYDAPRLTPAISSLTLNCVTTAQTTLQLRNDGTLPLRVFSVRSLIDSVTIFQSPDMANPLVIEPNMSATIKVQVNLSAQSATSGTIEISSNSDKKPLITTVFSATRLYADFTLSEPGKTVSFGLLKQAGVLTTTTTTLKNTGTMPISITPGLRPDNYFQFVSMNPATVEPGKSAVLTFSCQPDVLGKVFNATLPLSGACGNLITLSASTQPSTPALTTASVSGFIPRARIVCEQTAFQRIALYNYSNKEVQLEKPVLTGVHAAEFSVHQYPTIIPPLSSDTIMVLFQPQNDGIKNSTLTIRSNAQPNYESLSMTLTAEKQSVRFRLTPESIQKINLPEKTVFDTSMVLRNTGTIPLSLNGLKANLEKERFIVYRTAKMLLNPQDTTLLRVRFLGGDEGQEYRLQNALRIIEDSCQTALPLNVTVATAVPYPLITPDFRAYSWADTVLCPGRSPANKLVTYLIVKNRGTKETLFIHEAKIEGADAGDFLVMPGAVEIPPGSAGASFTLHFIPRDTGSKSATLVLRSNSREESELRIPLSGRSDSRALSIDQDSVDFVFSSSPSFPKTATANVRNTGTLPVVFRSFPQAFGAFRVQRITPNPLLRGATGQMTVEFTATAPNNGVTLEERISPQTVNELCTGDALIARAKPPQVSVFLNTAAGRPGDTVEVKLFITGRKNLAPENIGLQGNKLPELGTINLSYNASLLKPLTIKRADGIIPMPEGTVINGTRTLPLPLVIPSADTTVPAMSLFFRTLLGTAPMTLLRLSEPQSSEIQFVVGNVGAVSLLGLAQAGGTRLINSTTGVITNVSITPNPVATELTVTFSVENVSSAIEIALSITDYTGASTGLEQWFMAKPEAHTKKFDVSGLKPGVYYVNIRSHLQSVSVKCMVNR